MCTARKGNCGSLKLRRAMHARGYATSWRCAPRISDDHALMIARLEAEASAKALSNVVTKCNSIRESADRGNATVIIAATISKALTGFEEMKQPVYI